VQPRIPDEFRKRLLLDDIQNHDPTNDPYIFIACSVLKRNTIEQIQGELQQYANILAFLVPVERKNLVIGKKFSHKDFHYAVQSDLSYFKYDGHYDTGETFEEDSVEFEIIVNDRHFEGLDDLSYYEPTDRLVKYLNLHRNGNTWINPYTNETIIKTGDTIRGWEKPHNTYLSVRKSELIDYLAARRCGLLLLRYSDCRLETTAELDGLPEPFNNKSTRYGQRSWIINKDILNQDEYAYFSRLWDSFWIDPASHPRRRDARPHEEFKDGISFVLSDGEQVTYKQGDKNRYFESLYFKPTLFKYFLSQPSNRTEFFCLSIINLYYADASCLSGSINQEGQFQTFFGSVAELDIEKQRQLAAFSEPRKANSSYEHLRTMSEAKYPETMPFNWTLCNCLMEVNSPWQKKFRETLLLCPEEAGIPIFILIGPTSYDFNELVDLMMEFQKSVIPESKIKNIKKQLNYVSSVKNANDYENMKSIKFTRLFFRVNRPDQTDGESYILDVIGELRNCKGHPKDVEKVLKKYDVPATSPRTAFLHIMAEFCGFLSAFKTLTEKVLGVTAGMPRERTEDPWLQLQVARKYFLNPEIIEFYSENQ
jgi:hypothetical protein